VPPYNMGGIPEPPYKPYVGTLQAHMDLLLESNATEPPRNYGFLLVTDAGVYKVDPRIPSDRMTELERVWGGPSARYWNQGIKIRPGQEVVLVRLFDNTPDLPQIELGERFCVHYVYDTRLFGGHEMCGPDHTLCCGRKELDGSITPLIDQPAAEGTPLLKCGIGVIPILCDNKDNENLQIQRLPPCANSSEVSCNLLPEWSPTTSRAPPKHKHERAHYPNGRIVRDVGPMVQFNNTYPFRILEIQEHAEALSYDQLTMIRMREAVVADLPGFAEEDED